MTITRAKKKPAKAPKAERAELTPDEFIAAAEPARRGAAAADFTREEKAQDLVRYYMPWSAGAGLLPIPWVDLVTIGVVQLRLLQKMAELYDVPFREEAGRSFVATSLSTVLQYSVSGPVAWAMKAVPGVGSLLGMAVLPAIAAATTYALGRVFITHFESGGTFLDFDPKKVESHFRAEFDKARAAA